MSTSSTRRRLGRTVLVALLAGTSSCAPAPVRIPLAVPLAAVGGSRPATPQGLELSLEFGDGVWGQDQERVEIAGAGFGFAIRDRFELSVSGYQPSGRVQGQTGEATTEVRGKIRLGDFMGGWASIGVHVARMTSERRDLDAQDERLTAWDLALPMTFYTSGAQFVDHRWSVYAAPRLIFQRFEDRMTSEVTKGTLAAALVGVRARWRRVAVTGEMNLAHTPGLNFGNTTFQGGWILLPMASVSVILPLEN